MKKNHARADNMTQCTISLPKDLLIKIKKEAATENRNVSNYVVTKLMEQMDSYKQVDHFPLQVAEDRPPKRTEARKKA